MNHLWTSDLRAGEMLSMIEVELYADVIELETARKRSNRLNFVGHLHALEDASV